MLPYISIFVINIFFAYFADYSYNRNRALSIFFLVLIVIINTIFCGCRDFGVGIDTNVYILSYYKETIYISTIKDFFYFGGDKGFLALAIFCRKIYEDPQTLLWGSAFIIMSFWVISLYQYKKLLGLSYFFYVLLFCLIFYCHSINLMRQFCAMMILLYGFTYVLQRKWFYYIIFQLIAFYFHSTALLFMAVPIIYIFAKSGYKYNNCLIAVFVVMMMYFASHYYLILSYVGNRGIIDSRYVDSYTDNNMGSNAFGSNLRLIFTLLLNFIILMSLIRKKIIIGEERLFLLSLFVLIIFCEYGGRLIQFFDRTVQYYLILYYMFISKFLLQKNVTYEKYICMIIAFSYWYFVFAKGNGGDVLPYRSFILGI